MNIQRHFKRFATLLAALTVTLAPLRATKVAGNIDADNGLVLSLLPDPTGRPASVVVSNAAGTQFITEANTRLQIASYNSAPTAPQPVGTLPGAGALNNVLTQVLQFVDPQSGQQVVVAINQSQAKGTTVATLQGKVTLNLPGGQQLKIDAGTGAIVDNSGQPTQQTLAQLIAADKAANGGNSVLAAQLMEAVQIVAADVASNTVTGDAAAQQLAAIVQVAAQADPGQAAAFVTAAVTAVGQSNLTNDAAVISAVVTAATQGNAAAKADIIAAASSAASSTGNTFNEAVLTQQQAAVNALATQTTTTPVNIDVSIVSRSGG